MLVLSRKTGDIVKIGDDVQVKILQIKGKKVRLGVVAHPELNISSDFSLEHSEVLPVEKARFSRDGNPKEKTIN